jgi:predicted dinucleotide-binding enzyme
LPLKPTGCIQNIHFDEQEVDMDVTIIGTGKMGRAISTKLLEKGNSVNLVGHTNGSALALASELQNLGKISAVSNGSIPGEVVILAVPPAAIDPILRRYTQQLAGKILVDITNPVNYKTMDSLYPGSSGAEHIAQTLAGKTSVIKAFNTTFAATLLDEKTRGMPLDVFIAGDSAQDKQKITQLIDGDGIRVIDTGPLARARQLEALGLLHIALQSQLNGGFKTMIKLLK